MSVLFYRGRISRAVTGELPAAAEENLRHHLRGCRRCRAHYDRLSLLAEGLGAAGGSLAPRLSQRRARDRLLLSLDGGGAVSPPEARSALRRWWPAAALLVAVPVAAVLFMVAKPARREAPADITWRGESAVDAHAASTESGSEPLKPGVAAPAPAPAALLIYASRKEGGGRPGPVRLVADLPASGEGQVSLSDYVQFSVRGLATPAFITVVGVDDNGTLHVYVPRPGSGAGPIRADEQRPISLGPSIDLQKGHRPGRLRLHALFSLQPIDEAQLRRAATQLDLSRPGAPPLPLPLPQVSGLLVVSP